jgi:pimeloyl-ACP methyl ester carboxylesterase
VTFAGRFLERTDDGEPTPTLAVREAQYDAGLEGGIAPRRAPAAHGIQCPTLILQGDDNLMIPTRESHRMAGLIPDARIRTYPDAAHAWIFQYPVEVARDVDAFLV